MSPVAEETLMFMRVCAPRLIHGQRQGSIHVARHIFTCYHDVHRSWLVEGTIAIFWGNGFHIDGSMRGEHKKRPL